MPIHALHGRELKLVRLRRDHGTRRQTVIAEVGDGSHIVLPIDWTDRGAPWATPRLGGRDVKLCARGMLLLGKAVATALCQELGHSPRPSSAWTEAEPADKTDISYCDPGGGVDGSLPGDAARPARRVGKSAPQNARRTRGGR